jgi:hypothetical protein
MDHGGTSGQRMLMSRRSLFSALAAMGVGFLASGCGQDLTLSTDTGSTLCIDYYKQCVDPIFRKSFVLPNGTFVCVNCHGGANNTSGQIFPGKSFQINPLPPTTDQEWLGNFESARAQALDGVNSRLLVRPLGVNHGIGPQVFVGTGDQDYQRILYWIQNPVDSPNSAQCLMVHNPADPCP